MTGPVTPSDPCAAELREAAAAFGRAVEGPAVDLAQAGKALGRAAAALARAFAEAGVGSVRMRAAAKALDLRTPKGELERFVG